MVLSKNAKPGYLYFLNYDHKHVGDKEFTNSTFLVKLIAVDKYGGPHPIIQELMQIKPKYSLFAYKQIETQWQFWNLFDLYHKSRREDLKVLLKKPKPLFDAIFAGQI
jgi:hypothetical protein